MIAFAFLFLLTLTVVALVLLRSNRGLPRRRWRRLAGRGIEGRVGSLTIEHQQRHYVFFRPPSADMDVPLPLVMAFHGGFGNPVAFANRSGLNLAARRHGFAVVYPAAAGHWADGREHTGSAHADLEFVIGLIDHLRRNECIDEGRIYALGTSNGGMFIHRLGLELPQLFAALAAAQSSLPTGLAYGANGGPPVPLMLINAMADEMIPWRGGIVAHGHGMGGTVLGVEETVAFWQTRNRCADPAIVPCWRTTMDRAVAAELYEYPADEDGAELCFLKLLQGGHQWPQLPLVMQTNRDGSLVETNVTDLIWTFFSRHARSGQVDVMPVDQSRLGNRPFG